MKNAAKAFVERPFGRRMSKGYLIGWGIFSVAIFVVVNLTPLLDFTVIQPNDRPRDQTWQGVETTHQELDGVGNVPGDSFTARYKPSDDVREVSRDADLGAGPHDGALWALTGKGGDNISRFEVEHVVYEPSVDTPSELMELLYPWDESAETEAGRPVARKHLTVDGHDAYLWRYRRPPNGARVKIWLVPGVVHSYWIRCVLPKGAPRSIEQACDDVDRAIKFKLPPEPVPGTEPAGENSAPA